MNKDEILQAVKDGYKAYAVGDSDEAAKTWLTAWKAAQTHLMLTGCKKEKDIIDAFGHSFLNWFFDFDASLMECGLHNERLEFNRYLLSIPDYMDRDNPRLNLAESLASLKRYDEVESMLSTWLEEDPLWTYGWTSWANILLDNGKNEKAYEIMERGLTTVESSTASADLMLFYSNAEGVFKRLGKTEKAAYCAKKDREQQLKAKPASTSSSNKQKPITVSKVGRNDPCPCGSGKKYKKCCGQ